MSTGEVHSHFSTLTATGNTRVKEKFRELEHGDYVFLVASVRVNNISFPQDKDGLIERRHAAKADEMYLLSPEQFDKIAEPFREEADGQGSILAEIERNVPDNANE